MRLNELKSETFISIDIKLSTLNSNKPSSYYDQPSADLIKCLLLKLPEKYSHTSQFTKHLSSVTLEDNILPRIQNGGMRSFLISDTIYQQKRTGQHKISQSITSQHIFFSPPTRHTS